jgi:hypothetical protein
MKEKEQREELSFTGILRGVIAGSLPVGAGLRMLKDILILRERNVRRKKRWGIPPLIPWQEVRQQQEEAAEISIALLMHAYRDRLVSSHVTADAVNHVLKEIRSWVRQRYMQLSHTEYVSNEDLEKFARAVFHPSAEKKMELFDRLYEGDVIDMVEIYFLYSDYRGETTSVAAARLDMDEGAARKLVHRARKKIQKHMAKPDEDFLSTPKRTAPMLGLRVVVSYDKLMSAFRHLICETP